MLFAIGTRVRFRYTGETGVITAQVDDDMVLVRLDHDRDMEIPAFMDDLVSDLDNKPKSGGARFIGGKQQAAPAPPPKREIKGQPGGQQLVGIQLVFEPMPGRDGSVSRYNAWLINDSPAEFIYELELFTPYKTILKGEGKLGAATAIELGDMLYDELSEIPEVDITIQRITTQGPEPALDKRLKIRPKQFFNKLQAAPILQVLAYHFVLFTSFEQPEKGQGNTDLRDYTKQIVRDSRTISESNATPFRAFDVDEFAHFVPEIDLHIENLTKGYARLDPGEILRIQLRHFNQFLEKAIRLGVPQVFIIHGVGEGRLREVIAQQLRSHPMVAKFKNEYHAKYGYGATEVIFR